MKEYKFCDNTNKQRYELELEDGLSAIIDYRIRPNGTLVFTHTEVPYQYGNQGIGQQLVKKTLDHVRNHDIKIVPQCSFIATYIQRHPECADLVDNNE